MQSELGFFAIEWPLQAVRCGEDLHVVGSLPDEFNGLKPHALEFDDSAHWQILDVVIGSVAMSERAPSGTFPVQAAHLSRLVACHIVDLYTIQRRMPVEIIARAQKNDLRFRCVVVGRAARSPG